MYAAGVSVERPFPGLRPFGRDDREFFFGRDDQISALYRLLDRNRFIAVVGSSGSGKSSLVLAGLLPLLEDESNEPGGRAWRFAMLRPGDAPLSSLIEAVSKLAAEADPDPADRATLRERIEFTLRRSSFGITRALDYIPSLADTSLVLVVDQFEELFRYARSAAKQSGLRDSAWRDEAANFVQLLLEASLDRSRPIHVVITMRSDFIGDCSQFYDLPEAVSAAQFLVPSLTRDQREEVIRLPVEMAGGKIDATLVQRLLNDASTELDQLPVLQHCLARLWSRGTKRKAPADGVDITEADYEDVHRIAGALSQHADEIMSSSELAGLEPVVEKVFRALSEVDTEGRATRRALSFERLLAETGVPEDQLRTVLERFRADDCSFIVPSVASAPILEPGTRIDVVHEALLRRWEKITPAADESLSEEPKGWLAAEAADGRFYRGLLALLETRRVGPATLPLDLVEEREKWWQGKTKAWAERYGGKFERVDRLFKDSRTALDAENARNAEQAQLERTMASDRRRAGRTFAAAVVIGIIALIAALSGLVSFTQRQKAVAAEKYAETQAAAAASASKKAEADRKEAQAFAADALRARGEAMSAKRVDDVLRERALNAAAVAKAAAQRAARAEATALARQKLLEAQTIKLDQARQEAYLDDIAARSSARQAQAASARLKQLEAYQAASNSYNAAVVDERDEDWQGEVNNFSAVLRYDPQILRSGAYNLEPNAYAGRGWAEYKLNNVAAAVKDYKKAVAVSSNDELALYRLGYAYEYYYGDYAKAVSYYTEAIQAARSVNGTALQLKGAYDGRAASYEEMGRFDQAIDDTTTALKVDAKDSGALETRGFAESAKEQYDKAAADYAQAAQIDPTDSYAYRGLGLADTAMGQYATAESALERASALAPTNAYSPLLLQIARWKAGTSADAPLAPVVATVDLKVWPGEIVDLYLGSVTLDKLLADARGGDTAGKGHLCEADYFGAEYSFAKADQAAGDRLLIDANAICPKNYIVYPAMKAEVARLGLAS